MNRVAAVAVVATVVTGMLALSSCRSGGDGGTAPDTTTTPPPPPPPPDSTPRDTTPPPPPPPPPGVVMTVAGNIASCGEPNDEITAAMIDTLPGVVFTLGDAAFPAGTPAEYANCYGPTWGRFFTRTNEVLGNHDYDSSQVAAGAFGYFGDKAGPAGKGFYSTDVGAWHVIVLNDNIPFGANSDQETWLRADLAAHPARCTMALWHMPMFLSSNTTGFTVRPTRKILWDDLAAAGADVVLNGHQHHYERMAPMRPDGTRDTLTGITQFNVGTGGASLEEPDSAFHPNSEVHAAVFGVLKLTLRNSSYAWQFLPVPGQTFSDSGTARCH